jgi:carboxypeptidase Q
MMRSRSVYVFVLVLLFASLVAHSQVRPTDAPDTAALNRIWLEGTTNSLVMEHLSWLADVFGPRIPGTPAYNKAAAWAVQRFKDFGLVNAAIEPVGELGAGWSCEYVSVHMTAPSYLPIVAYSRPWTGSTNGKITGSPIFAPIATKADMEKYTGKLKGAIVLVAEPGPVHHNFDPPARRYDDKDLRELEETPIPVKPVRPGGSDTGGGLKWEELEEFFKAEEVGCLVQPSTGRADFGTVHVDAYGGMGRDFLLRGQRPRIIVEAEQYNRICRILDLKVPVTLEIEVRTTIYDGDTQGYDVTAEIPGTDKKDELVMLGGHLDSWTGGTGAVDNAAGCAVAMEAVRILKAIGIKPRRTIRAAFWTGEEEGLYGSRGYVVRHFGDTDKQSLGKMSIESFLERSWRNPLGDSTKFQAKPEYAKISGYFNYDNGSGRIRGIYLQENFQVRPIFEAWMKPLQDLGVTTLALQNTDGTDHLPFDYIGIPGFQFIQDPLDYFPYLHHTNQDVYDHAVPEDLVQSAIVMAYFVYQTAMRDEMLPRKALSIPVEMPAKIK